MFYFLSVNMSFFVSLCVLSILAFSNASDVCNSINWQRNGIALHLSWKCLPGKRFNWYQGRSYCKNLGMDLVALDSEEVWQAVKGIFDQETPTLQFIWTSGRKCNFRGCDHPRFQPRLENGWFWAATGQKLANPFSVPNECDFCEWSPKGGLGPQPDNREGVTEGKEEACLAVLNNLYKDGLKWHDIACHHRKPVICQ